MSEDSTAGVLLSDEGLRNAAFGLNAGGVSAPVETTDGVYIIKVLERVESHVATYEEARERVEVSYKLEKSIESAMAAADELLKKVAAGESFDSVIKEGGLTKADSGFVIRERAFVESIGLYIGDMNGFFKLTSEAPYYPDVISHNNVFYVFKFSEMKAAKRAPFDANISEVKRSFMELKRAEAQNKWIEELRDKSDISVNQNFF